MPASVRDKLRPDILITEGLPLHAGIALTTSPSLSHLQRSCRIHIVEVGYCSDSSSCRLQARPAKELQTRPPLLCAAGPASWVLAQPPAADPGMPVAAALPSAYRYSVIMLGHTGTAFEPFTYLKPFWLPVQDVRTLMHDLHDHAVQTAHAIVTLRRRLEHSACSKDCTPPDLS